MKKNKGIKICIMIACICIILGSIIIGIGIVKGGNLHSFTFNRTFNWFPIFSYDEDVEEEDAVILNDLIKNINVNADIANIEVKRGNTNTVTINNIKKQNVKVNYEIDSVSIDIKNDFVWGRHDNRKICVQLKDDLYESMHITSNLGKIDIGDIRAKKFVVNSSVGKVKLNNIYSEDLNIEQSSGDVMIKGVLLGNSIVNNELGKINVGINGKQQDYRYKVHAKLGMVNVQDEKSNGFGTIKNGNPNANNNIELRCSFGDVELFFE